MSASKNYPFRPRLDGTFIVDGYNNPYFCFKTKTKRKGGSTIRRSYAPVSYEQIIAWEKQAAQHTPTMKDRIKIFLGLKPTGVPTYTPDVLEIKLKKPSKPIDFGTVMNKFLKNFK